MKKLDLVGMRFGKLVVLREYKVINNHLRFECICDCGKKRIVAGYQLKLKRISCCGCSNGDVKRRVRFHNPQLYTIWKGIKARCTNIRHSAYKNYGGMGVKMCKEWQESFIPFYKWCMDNNWKPGMQIDKDIIPMRLGISTKLYSPDMCTIVTPKQNSRISRQCKLNEIIVKDILLSTLTQKQLANIYGVNFSTIQKIKSGKSWA